MTINNAEKLEKWWKAKDVLWNIKHQREVEWWGTSKNKSNHMVSS